MLHRVVFFEFLLCFIHMVHLETDDHKSKTSRPEVI